MFKKITIILAALILLPNLTLAANDVTFPQNSLLSLSDGSIYTIVNTSTFDTFTVNLTNIQFTVRADSIISLISADRKRFDTSGTNDYMNINTSCTSSQSTILIVVDSGAPSTYTVTVSPTSTCGATNTGGGGSSGGGGGGGGSGSSSGTTTVGGTSSLDSYSSGGGTVSLASPASESITATSGGDVSLANNTVSLNLPSNSLANDSTVTITPQLNYAQLPAGYVAVGSQVYKITGQTTSGSAISQLNNQATLTFSYSEEQIANIDETTLTASYWAEETGEWLNLPTTVNPGANTVTATTNHFSKFILQGKAVNVPLGSLIKTADSTAVYYLGHDNKRYVFVDDKVYSTWYEDFGQVMTISNSQMIGFSLGGNVTARAGTELVQFVAYDYNGNMIVDDPHVYAVEPGGIIRWLETAEIAAGLYGASWEQKIIPVNNFLFNNYSQGTAISQATYPTGAVVKETSSNNLYYINGSQKQLITTNGGTSNKFQEQYYQYATDLSGYSTSESLNDYKNSISWTSGK